MLKDDDPGGGEYATTTGHLDSLCVPIPGNLPLKKNTNARGLALGGGGGGEAWALLEMTDALYDNANKYIYIRLWRNEQKFGK